MHNTLLKDFLRCYESITNQTYPNIEIVIVNDRSDKSHLNEILKIAKKNPNVLFLNADGIGVSCARNTGVKYSHGAYIMFMDSDDILNYMAISEAVEILESCNLDIVAGRYKSFSEEEIELANPDFETYDKKVEIINTDNREKAWAEFFQWNQRHQIFDGWAFWPLPSWMRLLRRSICSDVLFPPGIEISEDTIWNFRLLKKPSVKIGLANCNWYAYIQHTSSVAHTIYLDHPDKVIASLECLGEEFSDEKSEFYNYYLSHVYRELKIILEKGFYIRDYGNFLQKYFEFFELCNKRLLKKINFRNIKPAKLRMKYLLFRSGMAYPWYALKSVLPI